MSERLRAGWGGSVHPFLLCLKDLKLEHWGEHILRTCLGRAHTAHMFTDSTPPIPACPHPSPQAVPGPPGHAGLPGGHRQRGADGAGARGPGALGGQAGLRLRCAFEKLVSPLAWSRVFSSPDPLCHSRARLAGCMVAGQLAAQRRVVQVRHHCLLHGPCFACAHSDVGLSMQRRSLSMLQHATRHAALSSSLPPQQVCDHHADRLGHLRYDRRVRVGPRRHRRGRCAPPLLGVVALGGCFALWLVSPGALDVLNG